MIGSPSKKNHPMNATTQGCESRQRPVRSPNESSYVYKAVFFRGQELPICGNQIRARGTSKTRKSMTPSLTPGFSTTIAVTKYPSAITTAISLLTVIAIGVSMPNAWIGCRAGCGACALRGRIAAFNAKNRCRDA